MESRYDGGLPPHGHLGRCAQDVLHEVRNMLSIVKLGGEFHPSLVERVEGMHDCHLAIALWYAAAYADMAGSSLDDVMMCALEYEVTEVSQEPQ